LNKAKARIINPAEQSITQHCSAAELSPEKTQNPSQMPQKILPVEKKKKGKYLKYTCRLFSILFGLIILYYYHYYNCYCYIRERGESKASGLI
jgi:hypothetical protein